ncbi:MAG: leucine-rich repeat domain-containing protein [Bacteroidales bacterium]|nr:leucine-rich repeat domain-containing protein [Bacteroidales bacterium]
MKTDTVKLHSIELYRYFRRLEDKPQILDVEILDSNPSFKNINFACKRCGQAINLHLENCTELTVIPPNALYENDYIHSIIIPKSVVSIGKYAFYYCNNIESFYIPENVQEIGKCAFYKCAKLVSINIPQKVKVIGNCAFFKCYNLKTIDLDITNPYFRFSDNVLYALNASYFKTFAANTEMTIYNVLKNADTIIDAVFEDCDLKYVRIPKSIVNIKSFAFSGCEHIEKLIVDDDNPKFKSVDGVIFSTDGSILYKLPATYGQTKYVIPLGVKQIAKYAFHDCTNITQVIVPETVESIEKKAFSCKSLKSITIEGNGLKSIGQWSFSFCESLTKIIIPESVTYIGEYAFYECSKLKEITLPNNLKGIADDMFAECSSLKSIDIPPNVVYIGANAFCGCTQLEQINLNSKLKYIRGSAFSHCYNLQKIALPTTVCYIGKYAFYHCEKLETIVIPNGIVKILKETFWKCYELKSLTIPESVTEIEDMALGHCKKLKGMTFPPTVQKIADNVFWGV